MKRLSAKRMYLAKWVIPLVALAFVYISSLAKELHKASPNFPLLTGVLIAMTLLVAWTWNKRFWCLADEVLDGGEYLLVRFGTRQQLVNLSNITDIAIEQQWNATTVRLTLASPCEFGHQIAFLAQTSSRKLWVSNEIAEDLVARVQMQNARRSEKG